MEERSSKELKDMIDSHEVIGIVNLLNIPAKQLQEMRKSQAMLLLDYLKESYEFSFFEDCANEKANINGLSEYMEGQPALVATDMNPFRLFKILEDNKTSAPAKVGSVAPEDIIIPAGDTGFEPGPFLGELQQVGVQAKIDKGKIVVSKDCVLVPEGEEVSKQAASTLSRLGINPMEVGIDLQAVYEDESIYTSDVLAIDEEKLLQMFKVLSEKLSIYLYLQVIPTKETISAIIGSAYTKATNVAVEAGILT